MLRPPDRGSIQDNARGICCRCPRDVATAGAPAPARFRQDIHRRYFPQLASDGASVRMYMQGTRKRLRL